MNYHIKFESDGKEGNAVIFAADEAQAALLLVRMMHPITVKIIRCEVKSDPSPVEASLGRP